MLYLRTLPPSIMHNYSGPRVTTVTPSSRQASTAARENLFRAIAALEHAVAAWLATPAAWDQRTHPSIRQFLVDIREYATALELDGRVSPNIIIAAADRLAGKVHDLEVDRCTGTVRAALDDYVQVLHG